MKLVVACACAAVVASLGPGAVTPGAQPDGGRTIRTVMREAHTSGLFRKVAVGAGDRADAERLLALYTELGRHKPPAGEQYVWQKRTGDMIEAARAAVAGDSRAGKMLKQAVNCGACHQAHKG
jgi:hypothetical protein